MSLPDASLVNIPNTEKEQDKACTLHITIVMLATGLTLVYPKAALEQRVLEQVPLCP